VIALTATGAASDISLTGAVSATNSGLTAVQPGINVTAGRDILITSTANLSTTTSGGIRLQAARDVDLKVNDGGANSVLNSINAVGNLDILATSGQIRRTDPEVVSLGAASVLLNAGANINAFGNITATSGNVANRASFLPGRRARIPCRQRASPRESGRLCHRAGRGVRCHGG